MVCGVVENTVSLDVRSKSKSKNLALGFLYCPVRLVFLVAGHSPESEKKSRVRELKFAP